MLDYFWLRICSIEYNNILTYWKDIFNKEKERKINKEKEGSISNSLKKLSAFPAGERISTRPGPVSFASGSSGTAPILKIYPNVKRFMNMFIIQLYWYKNEFIKYGIFS